MSKCVNVYFVLAKVSTPEGEADKISAMFTSERKAREYITRYNKFHNWFARLIVRRCKEEIKPFSIEFSN